MSDEIYRKLAKVLDTLPNGFPAREDQLELKLLKRIFEPEQAELFCDLRLAFESAQQIAERTGRIETGQRRSGVAPARWRRWTPLS